MGFPRDSDGEESACNVGDMGLIPGSGRDPGEGHGNPLQYSCLEDPMDRGAWWATDHGVAKSWTRHGWVWESFEYYSALSSVEGSSYQWTFVFLFQFQREVNPVSTK